MIGFIYLAFGTPAYCSDAKTSMLTTWYRVLDAFTVVTISVNWAFSSTAYLFL